MGSDSCQLSHYTLVNSVHDLLYVYNVLLNRSPAEYHLQEKGACKTERNDGKSKHLVFRAETSYATNPTH